MGDHHQAADRDTHRSSKEETRAGLHRVLGLREAVALGVGGTVGGGIFVLVGVAAGLAGPGALAAFGLAFAAALVIAVPYAELSCRLPLAGGGYAFVREVLGPHWGFLEGWGYWGAFVFVSGYVTIGFGGYLAAVTGLPVVAGAVGVVVASTALNLLGVRISGRAQALVVLVAVVGLVTFALWGLPDVRLEHLDPFLPFGGAAGRGLIAFSALLTTAATANAVLVVTSRIVFAMARDGLVPRRLGVVHPATVAPWAAVLVNGVLLAAVAAAGTVAFAAAVGGFLFVLHFVPPLAALAVLRRRRGQPRPAFTTPAPRVVLPVAFASSAALALASGTTGILFGVGWLAVGVVAYGVHRLLLAGVAARRRGV